MLYSTALGVAIHMERTEHNVSLAMCNVKARRTLSILHVTGLHDNIHERGPPVDTYSQYQECLIFLEKN